LPVDCTSFGPRAPGDPLVTCLQCESASATTPQVCRQCTVDWGR